MRAFFADKLLIASSWLHAASVATKDWAVQLLISRRRAKR